MTPITYRSADVHGLKVFYRQSGAPGAPKLEIATAIRGFLSPAGAAPAPTGGV